MCFALFLGARVAPPIIPCSGKYGDGQVYTQPLNDYNSPVRGHFTLPHVVYVGSDQGCGCGFRNTSFQVDWPDEYIASMPDYDPKERQGNHEALAALVRQHFGGEPFVELYGCWEGDFALPEKDRRELTLADITALGFHFHQLGFARIVLAGSP